VYIVDAYAAPLSAVPTGTSVCTSLLAAEDGMLKPESICVEVNHLAVEFPEALSYCRCKGFTFRTRWQILFEFELCDGVVASHLH
jgi:hypothetical protein